MFDGVTRTQLARLVPHRWRFAARRLWRALDRLSKGAPFRRLEPNPNPILVVGNQKSGTSAVAGLLAKASNKSVAIDLIGELIRPTVPKVVSGEWPVSEFLHHNNVDFTRGIIKDCHMTLIVDKVVEHIPGARVVYVVRDPRDNIRSIFNRLGMDGKANAVPPNVWRTLGPGWRLVLDGHWLEIDTDDPIVALSERWNRMTDVYLSQTIRMTLVRFEDFSIDRSGYIEQLASLLDLPPAADITRYVDTPFQPPGDRRISLEAFFGAENVARIENICGDRMNALGYSVGS